MEVKEYTLKGGIQQALKQNQLTAFHSKFVPGIASAYAIAKKWYGQPYRAKVNGKFYSCWDAKTQADKPFRLLINGKNIIVQPL